MKIFSKIIHKGVQKADVNLRQTMQAQCDHLKTPQVEIFTPPPQTKFRESTVFARVCSSFIGSHDTSDLTRSQQMSGQVGEGESKVTIAHDALELTVQGPLW